MHRDILKKRFLILAIALIVLTVGLPTRLPPAHAVPPSATLCATTDCSLSTIQSKSFSNPANGYVASEAKFDQSSGYSDGKITGYGGNNPNIWIGLDAGLGSSLRGLSNPNENIRTVEIDVSITDSSGNAFPLTPSTIGTSVWDTPYPSGASIDYAGLITDLSGYLAGFLGVNVPPTIHYSVVTPNGHYVVGQTLITVWTGYPNPCQITSISNSCSSTGSTSNDSLNQVDKTLNVKLIPTFSSPDVYKFTVSTHVERGDCYWSTVGDPRSGQVANSYYCRSLETLTQSYSFNYVYENDAGQGSGDAADSLPNANGSPFTLPAHGSYTGFLDGIDTSDVYGFAATQGEKISFSVTPPPSMDVSLSLYDIGYNLIQSPQDLGAGATDGVAFTAAATGTYYARISLTSGSGQYSFRLSDQFQLSSSPGMVNLGLAGTGSSATSTITISSPTDFTGRIDFSTSVSPTVTNGPSASLSRVTDVEKANPIGVSEVLCCGRTISNPTNGFVADYAYAVLHAGPDVTLGAYYSGYSISLPPDAVITQVEEYFLHYEANSCTQSGCAYEYGTAQIIGSTSQQSHKFNTQSQCCYVPDTWDITSLSKNWLSDINNLQVGWEAVNTDSYLDWAGVFVTYTTSSVTLAIPGASNDRTVTITSNSNTPAGTYTVSVTGTSGGSLSIPITATVQDFQLTASPSFVQLAPGQQTTSTITVSPINGFTGQVALSLSVTGSGEVLTSLSTYTITGGSGTSTLTILMNSTPNPDPATITVTGTSGGRVQTTTITVRNPPPNFAISTSPNRIVTPAGQANNIAITVTSLYGFTGTITLNAYAPSALSCSAPSPSSVTLTTSSPTAQSSVTCNGISGLYTLNATGTSGSIGNFALTGFTIQDFTISANPTSINALMNTWSSSTITINSLYGFSGTVSLSATVSPSGLYCPLTAYTVYGSGSSTLSCVGPPGTYTVTVTGSTGSLSHSTTVSFTVKGFNIAVSPSSISTPEGRTVSATVTLTSVNGYSGSVSLSAAVSCATYTFDSSSLQVPSPGSASTTIHITQSTNCNPATYQDAVTGTDSLGAYNSGYFTVTTSDFSASMQYSTFGIRVGATTTDNLYLTSNNGYSGTVSVSTYIQGNTCCAGWGAQNAQVALSSGGSATDPVTFTATQAAFNGYTVMSVTDGYIVRTAKFWVNFNDYNVTLYYNPVTVTVGGSTAQYLQIFPYFGIPLTSMKIVPTTIPNCITIGTSNPSTFNIGAVTPYSFITLPVSASSTCTPGTTVSATVKITGTSGTTSYDKSVTFPISIQPAPPGGGGGGGSVAAGTLITLANGTQVPVQNLQVGMKLISYDMTTHQYVTTTITNFVTVVTYNQMEIHTPNGKPLVVDQNPAQKLYVKLPDGTVTLMPVTDLKVGYDLFDAISQTWAPITSIHYQNGGTHLMYDIYTTSPGNYIANGYLDPLKT